MFKYEITYTDFNEKEQKETLRFHMTPDEFTRIKDLIPDDLDDIAKRAEKWGKDNSEVQETDLDDLVKVVDMIKSIVLDAYGEVSEDGRYFDKSEEIKNRFYRSAAYSELIDKFLTEPELMVKFINAITPKAAQK